MGIAEGRARGAAGAAYGRVTRDETHKLGNRLFKNDMNIEVTPPPFSDFPLLQTKTR